MKLSEFMADNAAPGTNSYEAKTNERVFILDPDNKSADAIAIIEVTSIITTGDMYRVEGFGSKGRRVVEIPSQSDADIVSKLERKSASPVS